MAGELMEDIYGDVIETMSRFVKNIIIPMKKEISRED
jgi:hypothetical protein